MIVGTSDTSCYTRLHLAALLTFSVTWAFFSLWQQLIYPISQFLGNFCKGVKIIHFSGETIFGKLL